MLNIHFSDFFFLKSEDFGQFIEIYKFIQVQNIGSSVVWKNDWEIWYPFFESKSPVSLRKILKIWLTLAGNSNFEGISSKVSIIYYKKTLISIWATEVVKELITENADKFRCKSFSLRTFRILHFATKKSNFENE